MSLKLAILGFLSWKPLTGYELKKMFEESPILYWSGNNNQIYKTLIALHKEDLVTQAVEHQADRPSRKIYTITGKGLSELKQLVLASPDLPSLRNPFLIQLSWADQLSPIELDALLTQYEEEIRIQALMLGQQIQRKLEAPNRTPRERYLWDMIINNWRGLYENELKWVRQVRLDLHVMEIGEHRHE